MRILWVTNIIFPEPSKKLGLTIPYSGGWMYSSAKNLINYDKRLELAVATIYNGKELKTFYIDKITYYLIPLNYLIPAEIVNTKYNKGLEFYWKIICDEYKPSLIHIHGSEFAHGLALLNAVNNIKTVVSIQGLVSVIHKYYFADLTFKDILKNLTFRDVFGFDSIIHQRKKLFKRGENEKLLLKKTQNIIGRTSWDRVHTHAINPNAEYHFCNEILRDDFYQLQWKYENCQPYSIFLSQSGSPLKGLHKVIKSLPYLIKKYPSIRVYVAGKDITRRNTQKDKLLYKGYGKYINNLIKRTNLKDHICFLGPLNAEKMVERYLKSNVFICSSSIENSPNSLGEAQLLGVPCISSYVGGVPDMIEDNISGFLYRFEDVELLADKISNVFSMNKEELNKLSDRTRHIAHIRHSPEINTIKLIDIYDKIVNTND